MEAGVRRLILGGEKSGKSDHALALLHKAPGPALLIATAQTLDHGFRERIMRHRVERGPEIPVREVTLDLPEALAQAAGHYTTILVEGLDYWLYACAQADCINEREQALLNAVDSLGETGAIFVSCETGLGPVAATREVRAFVRGMGQLNRRLAERCSEVVLVVAGRPLRLSE
ncbi:bifunctional adenosylcobinamide kinase/adenosylcobinamide-phosphate guanylyltransferase [Desulfovibrio ferrophilus]|uniref:Adenosylcobinamide kinase n=1 Tax=Desulfovibrio ferrophilus TaxID=241368 RepID=A0A2Z6B2V1_9BACT|nr:bifunctional adenosylcobinamide kinase/adenosylcobinamide-phosphate guanylyltransferase [Desulfovibrio ferrophilus]BBD09756.1 cobalamin biosynthesis protein [Desulfovibrio ferrophilus]